ncbi:MAG: hypothetical protein GXO29_06285, partial [Thermotogae bacterium]|nr:hypothetical protein [Thermotogota bacterium]
DAASPPKKTYLIAKVIREFYEIAARYTKEGILDPRTIPSLPEVEEIIRLKELPLEEVEKKIPQIISNLKSRIESMRKEAA